MSLAKKNVFKSVVAAVGLVSALATTTVLAANGTVPTSQLRLVSETHGENVQLDVQARHHGHYHGGYHGYYHGGHHGYYHGGHHGHYHGGHHGYHGGHHR